MNKMVFHQDKSSSRASNRSWRTFVYTFPNVNVVTEWMPKGPDAAQIDFAMWEILIKRLSEANETYHSVSLKRAL